MVWYDMVWYVCIYVYVYVCMYVSMHIPLLNKVRLISRYIHLIYVWLFNNIYIYIYIYAYVLLFFLALSLSLSLSPYIYIYICYGNISTYTLMHTYMLCIHAYTLKR